MERDFQIGCTYNVLQPSEPATPMQLFEKIAATRVFDYVNWLPPEPLIDECLIASEKTGLPMTTGNCQHDLTPGDEKLFRAIRNAARVNMRMLNVMLHTYATDGHEVTVHEVADTYMRACDLAEGLGLEVSFELHVDCWSEKYRKVEEVIDLVRMRGRTFNFTVDYSHVIFKIDNEAVLEKSEVREAVERGELILDPFEKGNILSKWLAENVVSFAQFRPVSPNQPRNVWAANADGSTPRGIMYPFLRPAPGQWHSPWSAWRLAPCKKAFRLVMEHHLRDAASPLRYVITEMIASPDYGLNAGFSLLEHNAACARWIRETWSGLKALQRAGLLETEID